MNDNNVLPENPDLPAGAETESAGLKPYTTPKLTPYGKMNHLTRLGGGMNANDGDTQYGSPVS